MKIKKAIKLAYILIFLYILTFSIQNFYQGYHDVDVAFNFHNLGLSVDINTGGQEIMLTETYLRGVDRMTYSFVWICLDIFIAIIIGYIWRGDTNDTV